jgi:hypothetical protein
MPSTEAAPDSLGASVHRWTSFGTPRPREANPRKPSTYLYGLTWMDKRALSTCLQPGFGSGQPKGLGLGMSFQAKSKASLFLNNSVFKSITTLTSRKDDFHYHLSSQHRPSSPG